MTDISFYCFLWRLISVRRVRASNGRQNRFLYRSHRNGQSRKNIVFMRLCGVSGIHFLRRGEQIILLFFIDFFSQNKDINEMNNMFRNKVSNNKATPQDYLKFVYNFSEQKESFESFFAMIKKSYIKRQPIISLSKRVTCFSEVNDSILMWSYYADKHQGVCLEYNPILLNDGNDEHMKILNAIQKVQYSEKQYNSVGFFDSIEDINTIFFSKALCWSHEQEWRIVLNENIEKLQFPCLTGVYLGANFDNSEKYCDIVRSVLGKDRYVALYDAVVDRKEYKIRFDCRNPK